MSPSIQQPWRVSWAAALFYLAAFLIPVGSSFCSPRSMHSCHHHHHHRRSPRPPYCSRLSPHRSWIGDLWSEVIEFSTLGPGERRLLAARRKEAQERKERGQAGQLQSNEELSFGEARMFETADVGNDNMNTLGDDFDDLTPAAFAAAVKNQSGDDSTDSPLDDFDGYALRDLLVSKWGAPLDVDFQRNAGLTCVYCTVLPFAYGQKKCRHLNELAYLSHLQGVVEVLRQYDNLDQFVDFVQTTNKVPRAGTHSVPFRLSLSEGHLEKIL